MIDEGRVYTVVEAAKALRISARSYYAGLARGQLPGVRIGRVIRVSGSQLARLLEVGKGVLPMAHNGAGNGDTPPTGAAPRA